MRYLSILVFSFAALLFPVSAVAADNLRADVDYIELQPPLPVRVPAGKIEVMEFFNFSCPHCFRLQGHLAKWHSNHKADDVVFVHQPLVFSRYKGHYARVYYTLQGLQMEDELLDKVYNAIHTERQLINSKERFLDWLDEQGVDSAQAEQMYDSFTVQSRANRAATIADEYGISSTPQMAINGKYVINPSLSGSYKRMMEIMTTLIERERQAHN